MAVGRGQAAAVDPLQLRDDLQGGRPERLLSLERVQHDAFQQITEGQVQVFGQALEHLEQAALHPDPGLDALHGRHVTFVPWYTAPRNLALRNPALPNPALRYPAPPAWPRCAAPGSADPCGCRLDARPPCSCSPRAARDYGPTAGIRSSPPRPPTTRTRARCSRPPTARSARPGWCAPGNPAGPSATRGSFTAGTRAP